MQGKFQEAAEKASDPLRKRVLAQFATNIKMDMADSEELLDPASVTNEGTSEFVRRITERMNKLTESMKPPES
jgi:hypothetical protein